MRNGEIVHRFGEHFAALIFDNMGFEADIVDADGIDLMCYGENDVCYGVSVKTRNIESNPNNSINLTWKDIVYADTQAKLRGGDLIYTLIISELNKIDVFMFTQEFMFDKYFKDKGINNIEEYKEKYPTKPSKENPSPGSTLGIPTGNKAKEYWKTIHNEKGVIFTASYSRF